MLLVQQLAFTLTDDHMFYSRP